jgi:hypothetical protein
MTDNDAVTPAGPASSEPTPVGPPVAPTPVEPTPPAPPVEPTPPAPPAPPAEPTPPATAGSATFGRADADGSVYVRTADGEVLVGQFAAGSPEEGLAFYARKYDDLVVELELAERRLRDGRANPDAVAATCERIRPQLAEPKVVGDLTALAERLGRVEALVGVQRSAKAEAKAAARAEAVAAREAIVVEAESLSDSTSWKPTGDRFRDLLEQWKTLPHGDRASEQALWKRFSAARSAFDKRRRAPFARSTPSAGGQGGQGGPHRRGRGPLDVDRLGRYRRRLPRPHDPLEGRPAWPPPRRGLLVGPLPRRAGRVLRGPQRRPRQARLRLP